MLLPVVAGPITTLFNISIKTGIFPSSWKIVQAIPVYKKENCAESSNYRPLTLLPLLSKVIKYVVHLQLKLFLERRQNLHPAQHRFRSKPPSCSTLLQLSNRPPAVKNDEQFSAFAVLNYSKAFDTINHGILISKLSNYFDASALSWFESYLREREQYVMHNSVASNQLPTSHGISHGSIIGSGTFLTIHQRLIQLSSRGQHNSLRR